MMNRKRPKRVKLSATADPSDTNIDEFDEMELSDEDSATTSGNQELVPSSVTEELDPNAGKKEWTDVCDPVINDEEKTITIHYPLPARRVQCPLKKTEDCPHDFQSMCENFNKTSMSLLKKHISESHSKVAGYEYINWCRICKQRIGDHNTLKHTCLRTHFVRKVSAKLICGMDGCTEEFTNAGGLRNHRRAHSNPKSKLNYLKRSSTSNPHASTCSNPSTSSQQQDVGPGVDDTCEEMEDSAPTSGNQVLVPSSVTEELDPNAGKKEWTDVCDPVINDEEKTITIHYPLPARRVQCPKHNDKCKDDVKQKKKCVYDVEPMRRNSNNTKMSELKTHLNKEHPETRAYEYINWCRICDKSIGSYRTVKHPCLLTHFVRDTRIVPKLVCGINGCVEEFDNARGLSTHKHVHADPNSNLNQLKRAKASNTSPSSSSKLSTSRQQQEVSNSPAVDDIAEEMDIDEEIQDPDEVALDGCVDADAVVEQPEVVMSKLRNKYIELLRYYQNGKATPSKWVKFNDIITTMIPDFQQQLQIKTVWLSKHYYENPTDMSHAKIRKLYDRNPKRAMKIISKSNNKICQLEVNDIQAHYSTKFDAEDTAVDSSYFDNISAQEAQVVKLYPFPSSEIVSRLKKFTSSAPGPDKLQYRHWLNIDPKGELLFVIYSICLHYGNIPSSWKSSKTFLFNKTDNPTTHNDWRPISLLPTIYKLFSSLLAKRIREWCDTYHIMNLAQKGGSTFDVTLEHTYVLDYVIYKARTSYKGDVSICFLDIKNAYPSLPVKAVTEAFEFYNAGEKMIDLVKNILKDRKTQIISGKGSTEEIRVNRGVLTGDPVSGVFFNLVLNSAIIEIEKSKPPESPIPYYVLAAHDDIVLFDASPDGLQRKVTLFEKNLRKIHLSLSYEKSKALRVVGESAMCYCSAAGTEVIPIHLEGTDAPIKQMGKYDHHEFLGVEFGYQKLRSVLPADKAFQLIVTHLTNKATGKSTKSDKLPDPDEIPARWLSISKLIKDIFYSRLSGSQKINACKKYLFPKLSHDLRFGRDKSSQWNIVDNYLRVLVKVAYGLPSCAPNEYIYGARSKACGGFNNCEDDYYITKIANAFKLLTSPDDIIFNLARADLLEEYKKALRDSTNKNFKETLEFFQLPTGGSSNSSTWSPARQASNNLGVVWSLDAAGHPMLSNKQDALTYIQKRQKQKKTHQEKQKQSMIMKLAASKQPASEDSTVNNTAIDINTEPDSSTEQNNDFTSVIPAIIIPPTEKFAIVEPKLVMKTLRQVFRLQHTDALARNPAHGKANEVFCQSSFSNFIFNKCRNSDDWEFVHSARLNLSKGLQGTMPFKHMHPTASRKCRLCQLPDSFENVPHVLAGCKNNLPLYSKRHNSVQDLLETFLKTNDYEIHLVDSRVSGSASRLRPDLIATKRNESYLIDVSCPSDDDHNCFYRKDNEKIDKYLKLAKEWHELNPSYSLPIVQSFLVGARGAWCPQNDAFLMKITKSKAARVAFTNLVVERVIRWSRCIMAAHVDKKGIYLDKGGFPHNDTKEIDTLRTVLLPGGISNDVNKQTDDDLPSTSGTN